eukprot:7380402-Prymnesium_polylepis.2
MVLTEGGRRTLTRIAQESNCLSGMSPTPSGTSRWRVVASISAQLTVKGASGGGGRAGTVSGGAGGEDNTTGEDGGVGGGIGGVGGCGGLGGVGGGMHMPTSDVPGRMPAPHGGTMSPMIM